MALLRPFSASDLFNFNNVNLDPWTETYSVSYYLQYLTLWPDLINVAEAPNHSLMGYVMGKTEGEGPDWHGHVSAITVAPAYRRLSLARSMMGLFEHGSDSQACYFVDLFVRVSNVTAIAIYKAFGYSVFRRVKGYYSGFAGQPEEDAFDMRKSLRADREGRCVRSDGENVLVSADDVF